MRPIWRSVIPIFGLLLSLLLWHQQTVNLQAARADQNNSISKAVNSANDHTDKQISASNDHTDKQIEKVRRELSDNSTGTNNRLDEVDKNSENQNKAIQELLPGFQSTLGTALGKVGKPDPPQRVTLKFSLLSADDTAYTQNTALVPDKDGVFTVKFWILNDTGVTAHLVDVWIDLCESCEFIGEDGAPWQRPAGMSNLVRYCRLDLLNQHAATSVMSIRLRIKDDRFTRFSVGMRYSCELCVESPKEQIESILTAKQ